MRSPISVIVVLASTVSVHAFVARVPPHMGRAETFDERRCLSSTQMGFMDNFKAAFENEPKLQKGKRADVNAGINKNAPAYVREKMAARKAAEGDNPWNKKQKADEGKGDRTLKELFSGWTWE